MCKNTFILLLLVALIAEGCREKAAEFESIAGTAQGTTYNIVFESSAKIVAQGLKSSVDRILHSFDMSLSLYIDSSLISRMNRNEDVAADTFFTEVFNRSQDISRMTGGAFDITVGPLVRAWGFGPDAHKSFDVSKLDSLMKLIGYEKVSLKDGHLIKAVKGISLDVNAIAQGYSVDVIYRYFESLGIRNFLIEIGGEVRVKGSKAGDYWKIGIDKPEDNNMSPGNDLQAIIKIKDKALATSGNYRKFYVEYGIKYSHTINPATGYPAKNTLLSATIIAEDCATADGIATACMVMGKDKTIIFLSKHPELEAFLVFSDDTGNYKTWETKKLKNYLAEVEAN